MTRWWFLFVQWLKRDLAGRYRGSLLGMLWPLAQPVAQIAVFTLIFHGFMQVRWPVGSAVDASTGTQALGGAWGYALNVFAGLAVFNFFAEVLGRAPVAVLAQPRAGGGGLLIHGLRRDGKGRALTRRPRGCNG